jgi:DNA repair exonuclease SbcCD ATPase subunit
MEFSPESNNIYGANASGKTTVFDAVWFLFFGKDSTGRADFSIKTFDEHNNFIEKVDHEVYAEFSFDGVRKSFQRTYKQQWSKDNVLKGHTTDYEIDGFPIRLEKEFQQQIQEYFTEDVFKLLTNPLYFNSMKPKDKRQKLIEMASEYSIDEIIDRMPSKIKKTKGFQLMHTDLKNGATITQIRAKAAHNIKTYKEKKEEIPNRIDEAERSKPEVYQFDELKEIIAEKKAEIEKIEAEINAIANKDLQQNKAIQERNNQIFEAKTKLQKLEFQAQQEFNKWKNEQQRYPNELRDKLKDFQEKASKLEETITELKNSIERKKTHIQSIKNLIPVKESERTKLAEQWKQVNSETFEWNGETCPACERPLEGAQAIDAQEQAQTRFNTNKKSRLDDIVRRGTALKDDIEDFNRQIERAETEVRDLSRKKEAKENELEECKGDLINLETSINEWYATPQQGKEVSDFLGKEAEEIKNKINELENSKPQDHKTDVSELEANKKSAQNDLEGLQKALGHKDTIERINQRIEELKQNEKELAQGISEQEGIEEAAYQFSKTKVEMIEEEINSKFELVSFKLFKTHLNGNEEEICDTLYKGVPFNDLNNAGKIQAGLDVINGLSKHHNTYLPIFIDNRESVTWIPEVKSQLINLVVDSGYTELSLMAVTEKEVVN